MSLAMIAGTAGSSLTSSTIPRSKKSGRCVTLALLEAAPIVFVVDQEDSVRESLKSLIENEGWRPQTFASAQEFLDCPRAAVPSCLIFDHSLPITVELQKQIARERPETPIIVTSDHSDIPAAVQAMKAGAVEVLVKPFRNDALLPVINESLERSRAALDREMRMRDLRARYESLTRREGQVMTLVASGLLNKQVGAELGISEITVKAHRGQVMQKMKANSLADLVRMASRLIV